jgi:hypothetical protein
MDADNIERHTIPWQQILMFFTRTQATHEWASPNYKFTKRQRAAWNSLWKLAQPGASPSLGIARSASLATASLDDTSSEHSENGPEDQPIQRIASESPANRQNSTNSPFQLAPIDLACLNFCIELLNHRIKVEDYESALICATAVLGRGEAGWRTAESYPPILSKLIKIARFMVVHKALKLDSTAEAMLYQLAKHQMAGDWDTKSSVNLPDIQASDDDFFNFRTGPVQPPTQSSQFIEFTQAQRQTQRSFREWVTEIVTQFMVRRTNSPMQ